VEEVAALQPDLIVGTYAIEDQSAYDTFSGIAPTIASVSDAEVDPWQDITEVAGQILGRKSAARRVIDRADAKVRAVSDELPGLRGKTIAFANYYQDSFVVLANPDDGANVLFSQLGLGLAPGIVALDSDDTGRVTVSLERIDVLDGDVLAVLTNGDDVSRVPGWDNLPAVRSGAVAELDMNSAIALNTPSPLSIPYGIKAIRPALEAAAG
jgi:iron complex transport system substrate-binding protein